MRCVKEKKILGKKRCVSWAPDLPRVVADVGRSINQAAIEVKKDIDKSDPGKWVGGMATSTYNLALAVPRAVVTGDVKKESQRFVGSAGNLVTMGSADMVGRSSSWQNLLRSDSFKKWTLGLSENYAGITRGLSTMSRSGKLDNDDRNNMVQGGVKVAAIAAGVGAYGYLTAPAVAAPGASVGTAGGAFGMYPVAEGGAIYTGAAGSTSAAASSGGLFSGVSGMSALGYATLARQVLGGERSLGDFMTAITTGQPPEGDIRPFIDDARSFLGGPREIATDGGGFAETAGGGPPFPVLPVALAATVLFLILRKKGVL